jgi:hypothetical protein
MDYSYFQKLNVNRNRPESLNRKPYNISKGERGLESSLNIFRNEIYLSRNSLKDPNYDVVPMTILLMTNMVGRLLKGRLGFKPVTISITNDYHYQTHRKVPPTKHTHSLFNKHLYFRDIS